MRDRDRPPVLGNQHQRPWTAANWMLSSLSCMDAFFPPLCSCLSTFSSSLPLIPVLLWPSIACSPTDVGRKQALFEVEARWGEGWEIQAAVVVLGISVHLTHFFWIILTESFEVHQNDSFSNSFCQIHLYTFINESLNCSFNRFV